MNVPAIKAVKLTKYFGEFCALDNIDLEISYGEIFAFLGPNGAGKTTTIKLMSGLLKPTSGEIHIDGNDVQKMPVKAKSAIGLLPEAPFVYPKLTGTEYLMFTGDIYGVGVEKQKKRIPEILEMFGLRENANELIETYSHGMRQKIVLSSILLHEPRIIFLDEPLTGLDPRMARLVKDILLELSNRKTAVFMCTHVLELAEKLADRIAIIDKGKIIALESKGSLREKMANKTIEDIYLQLTGGDEYADLLKFL